MPEIRVTLLIEQDGTALPDFPIIRRYVVSESSGIVAVSQPADNNTTSYHPFPQITMPSLGITLLTMDQALNVKINLNTPIPFNADGLLLMLGTALTQVTASQNLEVNNPAVSTAANIGLLAGGT